MGEDDHPIEELEEKDQHGNLEQRFMKDSRDTLSEVDRVRNLSDSEFPAQLDDGVHGNRHGQSKPDNSALAQQSALRDDWVHHSEEVSA